MTNDAVLYFNNLLCIIIIFTEQYEHIKITAKWILHTPKSPNFKEYKILLFIIFYKIL